jgi:hypothetical protein
MKKDFDGLEDHKNLGTEAASRDAKVRKKKYKADSDNSRTQLHMARWNRQPLAPPEEFYSQVPKKHSTVVRNFPTEHLGITGLVPDSTIGHMHNRAVKISLDSFCKTNFKAAKGNEKAGKYADRNQIEAGMINYCMMLHSLWPADYTGLVILKVLSDAHWGDKAGLKGRYNSWIWFILV